MERRPADVFTVKEYHQQMSCNTAFVLSEMEGMTGEKEEVLIRVAEVWNLSGQGKIEAVRLFATHTVSTRNACPRLCTWPPV